MRADSPSDYDEVRDALDQQWIPLMFKCGLTPLLMPNNPSLIKIYLEQWEFSGILLTGGNNPVQLGGDSPARDQVDTILIDWACKHNKPLIGVCRGMQSIQMAFQQSLEPVDGHITKRQTINVNGQQIEVNSYHTLGSKVCKSPLQSWATSDDGVIKAVKHLSKNIYGIMWHPERNQPFHQRDIEFFTEVFGL